MLSMIVRGERSRTVVVDSDKKGDDENYCITIEVVPPLSQYNHNVHLTYCNTICKSQNFLNSHPYSVPLQLLYYYEWCVMRV